MTNTSKKSKKQRQSFPKTGTTAANNFFDSYREASRFLDWLMFMVSHIDTNAQRAHDVLQKGNITQSTREQREKEWRNRHTMVDELKNKRQFLLELVFVRHVENYLNYLSELLRIVFLSRPEALRSSETVTLSDVLSHNSIDEFVNFAAERKVDSLSYSSFGDLSDFFEERFHLTLFSEAEQPKIIEAIETRNISVHNRCIINNRYCVRTGCGIDQIGTTRAYTSMASIQLSHCFLIQLRELIRSQDANSK